MIARTRARSFRPEAACSANSRAAAGRALAELALGTARPPAGHVHAALRHDRPTWPAPSDLALRDDLMTNLWHDSAVLVGLPAHSR
jgi:hypothetical protein